MPIEPNYSFPLLIIILSNFEKMSPSLIPSFPLSQTSNLHTEIIFRC